MKHKKFVVSARGRQRTGLNGIVTFSNVFLGVIFRQTRERRGSYEDIRRGHPERPNPRRSRMTCGPHGVSHATYCRDGTRRLFIFGQQSSASQVLHEPQVELSLIRMSRYLVGLAREIRGRFTDAVEAT